MVYKYAMTMDGKICTETGESQWISNESSRNRVQSYRNELMAIMVGIETVLADDPLLSCRLRSQMIWYQKSYRIILIVILRFLWILKL